MSKFIWEQSKEAQSKWIRYFLKKRYIVLDKTLYKSIRNVFQSGFTLNDIGDEDLQAKLIKEIFYYKFKWSCSNARYVRVGKKKGYEDVKYLLEEDGTLIRNLHKYRPDLVELGIEICRKYIESGFTGEYAPVVHRIGGKGTDYEWNNITIIAKKEHDELTKKERQAKKVTNT